MPNFPDYATLENLKMIEELYRKYLENPEGVEPSWRAFFQGIDFGSYLFKKGEGEPLDASAVRIYDLIQAYRRSGHLLAKCNPLEPEGGKTDLLKSEKWGFSASELDQSFPTFGFCAGEKAPLKEILAALQRVYCSRIGFEYMDLGNPELEKWMQKEIEPKLLMDFSIEEKHLILDYLNRSEVFETFLHTKYVGQTRFSLEGAETMIPMIAEMIERLSSLGVGRVIIGMGHRGRLNVLCNILNKPLEQLLIEFEDDTALSFSGSDDLRYHLGFVGEFSTASQKKVGVEMPANPSHLESVDPVALGETFALQKGASQTVVPLLIHGDASIAGQGVIYESLQFMRLSSYSVGGTLHLVINNQIGYTTLPDEGRSTRYCTDIAKAFGCPVFHVNAEDPESCIWAARLAVEIRRKFQIDVFIDLLCYRKYGHNEGDEPSFTQPLQYEMIRAKKGIREMYFTALMGAGKLEKKIAETLEIQFRDKMKGALERVKEEGSVQGKEKESAPLPLFAPVASGVDEKKLQVVLDQFCKIPNGFHPHPKLQKAIEARDKVLSGDIDWAAAEMLAFGTLLEEGIPIRLAGQDAQRGTFNQRHMIWADYKNGEKYCPMCHFKAPFQIVNSPLSEYACMGFEYGYSLGMPGGLTLWEAQYGDFDNGAQIIIDQYIACAEKKWGNHSTLTLLLPHGYEGAGPEHSSCRLERFLQLAADQNIQVVYPSTPAQYFHLLRRQILQTVKAPLIILTPKGLLRAPACTNKVEAFTRGQFNEILDDPADLQGAKRVLFCSGKVFFDLLKLRGESAIVRVEQLYPLHVEKLKEICAKYRDAKEWIWVQEEPLNMGAWNYIRPVFERLGVKIRPVGRAESAATATASSKRHKQEQANLLKEALE